MYVCVHVQEKVVVGDVIYIEANSGAVKRVGRCDTYATGKRETACLPVLSVTCVAVYSAWFDPRRSD